MSNLKHPRIAFFLCAVAPTICFADVSFDREVTIDGRGDVANLSGSSRSKIYLADELYREDHEVLPTKLNEPGDAVSSTIISLDTNLVTDLKSERSVFSTRAIKELARQTDPDSKENIVRLPIEEGQCKVISEPTLGKDKSSRETVNGFRARKITITQDQICEDKVSSVTCKVSWTNSAWLAPDVEGDNEINDFSKSYARTLRTPEVLVGVPGSARALLQPFADGWSEIEEELAFYRGFPVKTVRTLELGGPECRSRSGVAIATDEIWEDASTAAYNAAVTQAGNEAGQVIAESAGSAMGDSVAGSIGGAAASAATNQVMGSITGMFTKKKNKSRSQPSMHENWAMVPIYSITVEIKNLKEQNLSPELFSPPEGWTEE